MSMQLTPEEQAIIDGQQGPVMQKVIKTVVLYGEVFGATRLLPISGMPHLVTSFGANTISPYFDMLQKLIDAGLKTKMPFTVDPRPTEYETLRPSFLQRLVNDKVVFGKQKPYEKQLRALGLKDENAFSCACYLPEVGNTPTRGQILAWSESSAVVYANSVLGARVNRNSAGIDLMCAILGKAPEFGFLTDEGRQATWLVEVKTSKLPNAQLLGSAIGLKVMEEVPYITGLDKMLGAGLNPATEAFLKDMGAATASNGAVGLYHVEGITPEAADEGRKLLKPAYRTYVIDDAELARVKKTYPVLWKNVQAKPHAVFIGCPHLSQQQLLDWSSLLHTELQKAGQEKVAVPTYFFTAPDVRNEFKKLHPETAAQLAAEGVSVTTICPLMYMNNPLCAKDPIVTNSNKLRTYSTARFFLDADALQIAVRGELPQGGRNDENI